MSSNEFKWEGRTEEEREAWVEEVMDRWTDLRDEVREAMASDDPEAEWWAQHQQQDLYGEAVRSLLCQGELVAQGEDEADEDVEDRFNRHCAREFRLGAAASSCARAWCSGGVR